MPIPVEFNETIERPSSITPILNVQLGSLAIRFEKRPDSPFGPNTWGLNLFRGDNNIHGMWILREEDISFVYDCLASQNFDRMIKKDWGLSWNRICHEISVEIQKNLAEIQKNTLFFVKNTTPTNLLKDIEDLIISYTATPGVHTEAQVREIIQDSRNAMLTQEGASSEKEPEKTPDPGLTHELSTVNRQSFLPANQAHLLNQFGMMRQLSSAPTPQPVPASEQMDDSQANNLRRCTIS